MSRIDAVRPQGPVQITLAALAAGILLLSAASILGPVAPAEAAGPNVTITKTAEPETINADGMFKFRIEVKNAGPAAADSVTVTDPLPGGDSLYWTVQNTSTGQESACQIPDGANLTCNFGALGANQSAWVEVTAYVSPFGSCATYQNTATAIATNQGGTTQVSDSATVTCLNANLTLTKTAADPTVVAGQNATFTITFANSGPGELTMPVSVEDQLPGGTAGPWEITDDPGEDCYLWEDDGDQILECGVFQGLKSGESVTVTVSAPTSTEACAVLENTVTAQFMIGFAANLRSGGSPVGLRSKPTASASPDDFPLSDTATVTCRQPAPKLKLTKTAAKKRVKAGQKAAFTITAASIGELPVEDLQVTDPLPKGTAGPWAISSQPAGSPCSISTRTLSCSYGDLPAGESRAVTVRASTSATRCGAYRNTATASATGLPKASAAATVRCQRPAPKLQLKKTANRHVVAPGQKVRYRIQFRNRRAGSVAKGVQVCDRIPNGLIVTNRGGGHFAGGQLCWKIGQLKGSSRWSSRHLVARVSGQAENGARLRNVASLGKLRAHWTLRVQAAKSRRSHHTPVTG